jgi:predicted O-linked N-acetylglucosamine transferase (SPINDLY family)
MEVDGRDDHKAVAAYEKAVKLSPKNPGVWMNMSAALRRLNLTIRAEVAVRKAIELKPDFAEAWNNLGGILRDQAKFDEAVGAYCTALNHRPDDVITHSNLVYLLNFVPGMSHEELREQFAVFNQTHFGNLVAADLQLVESDRDAPLRLGLLSSDLRCHSVGYFLRAALPALSAAGAELHVYADVSSPDELSHELRTSVHSWHWVSHQSDTDLANQIRSDALDVLLELNGHTAGNRLAMLATRVAPWQGSWLGFPASPECQGIDFFVSDEVVYPERGSDNSLILRVKGGAFPYAIPAQLPEVECSLHDSPLVFGAFHSFPKLNEHVWKDWIRLLNRFPNSRLKVKSKQLTESAALDQLLVKLKELEAPLERIDFLSYTDTVAAHLSCYREIDIALDPSPYNGVTTTMEALSMGVPVLTIPGETPASRHAASLLQSFVKGVGVCSGFEDMVAYIEKAESNLSEFRAKRIARHRDFVRRLDEHASQWAHEFINTITDQTKERKCQPQKN